MSVHRAARSLCTRLLASLREASSEPQGPPPAQVPTNETSPEEPRPEPTEFESFLSDLGSEPTPASEMGDSILKDATIGELTERLRDLHDLGDRLAATEIQRLAGLDRIAELEAQLKDAPGELSEARFKKLEDKVSRLTRARDREAERAARMRSKFEERKRVAADRWREMLELRRELKELRKNSKGSKAA